MTLEIPNNVCSHVRSERKGFPSPYFRHLIERLGARPETSFRWRRPAVKMRRLHVEQSEAPPEEGMDLCNQKAESDLAQGPTTRTLRNMKLEPMLNEPAFEV